MNTGHSLSLRQYIFLLIVTYTSIWQRYMELAGRRWGEKQMAAKIETGVENMEGKQAEVVVRAPVGGLVLVTTATRPASPSEHSGSTRTWGDGCCA